ncbi:DNA-binding protein [Paucibacter soli]|uniref:DNA-binding protein n=1 Tax=Paucibacter soli TaxID=3133433 RepID=UPI003096A5D7
MAKTAVTEAEVHRACDDMLQRGERPTQAKLVKLLGGSNTTVGPYLKTWNLAQDAKERERLSPVPTELTAAWGMALRQVRSEEEAKWAGRIAEQDEQLAELATTQAALSSRVQELEAANLQLATERDRLAGRLEAAQAGIESANAERQAALVHAQDAKVSLGQATQTIEGLRARVEDFLARVADQEAGIQSRDGRIKDLERDLAQAQAATRELAAASQAELRQAALELAGVKAQQSAESRAREGSETRVQALEARLGQYDAAISRAAAAESAADELRRQVEMLQGMLPATTK